MLYIISMLSHTVYQHVIYYVLDLLDERHGNVTAPVMPLSLC